MDIDLMDMFNPTPLEERATRRVQAVDQKAALERQPTRPIVTKKRGRWLLYGLSLLLIVLVVSGIFLGPTVYSQVFSPRPAPSSELQHILHPKTVVVHSSAIDDAANGFMQAMLQKNWAAMWSMLAPDSQRLWKDEQDFTHFEQTKFGPLTLQSYTLSQSVKSTPWLDSDTTQVYRSAVTLQIALQAVAPPDLLTVPSNNALNQGLFKNTLFSLIQNQQGAWQVLVAGPADLDAPVLVPVKPPVTHVILPIFMYHHISSLPTHNLFDFNLTVTTADFNKQLDWLQQQGYQTITMTELFGAFYYGKALPPKPVILTFDDGYSDIYPYALPALLAHHYRGVFYIITGMIGGRYMTWEQVRTLARSGMEVASHTIHHPDLAILPPHKVQAELADAKATLETKLGTPIQFFCYPTGEPFHHGSQASRQLVLKDLFNDGYLGATLDPSTFNSALQNSEIPYQMPRIRVSGGEILKAFIGILDSTLQADIGRLHALPNE